MTLNATLLLTRPQDAAERFAARIQVAGARIVISPILRLRAVEADPLDGQTNGLVITSAAAVRFGKSLIQGQRVAYCVGHRTTEAARAAGLHAQQAGQNAEGLISSLLARPPVGPLCHLRGRHSRGNVAARLTAGGLRCTERVVYDQVEQALTPAARAALQGAGPIVLPLFSPRSAVLLSGQAAGSTASLHLVAISPAVAESWRGPAPASLEIAARPDGAAMAQAVARAIDAVQRLEG